MQQGDVAQLVERVLSMHEVWGSIPHLSILLLLSRKFITDLPHEGERNKIGCVITFHTLLP